MALSNAVVTMNLADLLGTDFDTRRTKIWVDTNIEGDTVIDTVGNQIRLGSGTVTLNTDGTASLSVWAPGTGANPASWQTTIHVDYPDPGTRTRRTRDFGPFTITGNADLADLVAEQEVPPNYTAGLLAEMQDLRDQQVELSGIDSSDSATAYNVQHGTLTGPALAASSVLSSVQVGPTAVNAAAHGDDLQAAADALPSGGGKIYLEKPSYTLSQQVVVPVGSSVEFEGVFSGYSNTGTKGTTITCPTDLGADTYLFRSGTSDPRTLDALQPIVLRNLRLKGGMSRSVLGSAQGWQTRAVSLGRRGLIDHCSIEGFYAGVADTGDHHTIRDSVISNNLYGIERLPSTTAGDNLVEATDLTGNVRASLGVASGASYNGSKFLQTHFGTGPYGLWLQAADSQFLTNTLIGSSFEGCSNASMGGAGTVSQNTFIDSVMVGMNDTYKIAGENARAYIDVGTFTRALWLGTQSPFGTPGPHMTAYITNAIELDFEGCGVQLVSLLAATPTVPLIAGTSGRLVRVTSAQWTAVGRRANGALTPNQLVRATPGVGNDPLLVRAYDGTNSAVDGVALTPAADTAFVLIAKTGQVTAKCVTAITPQAWVKPDTANAGAMANAASATDTPPICGVAITSGPANGTFTVDLRGCV